ncbi:hypothetical protein SEA_ARGIE_85 [Mycobacterium phage Argie]|nr:hypothetical protein SEA_ARGIE_85 [Mycobacterium phage Argie]
MTLHCGTVGQLRAALADLPADAPLRIDYDDGCGGVKSIAVHGVIDEDDDKFYPWARQGDVHLSLDYDLAACENVKTVVHQCSGCECRAVTYTFRESGREIHDDLGDGGVLRDHYSRMAKGRCPGSGKKPLFST